MPIARLEKRRLCRQPPTRNGPNSSLWMSLALEHPPPNFRTDPPMTRVGNEGPQSMLEKLHCYSPPP